MCDACVEREADLVPFSIGFRLSRPCPAGTDRGRDALARHVEAARQVTQFLGARAMDAARALTPLRADQSQEPDEAVDAQPRTQTHQDLAEAVLRFMDQAPDDLQITSWQRNMLLEALSGARAGNSAGTMVPARSERFTIMVIARSRSEFLDACRENGWAQHTAVFLRSEDRRAEANLRGVSNILVHRVNGARALDHVEANLEFIVDQDRARAARSREREARGLAASGQYSYVMDEVGTVYEGAVADQEWAERQRAAFERFYADPVTREHTRVQLQNEYPDHRVVDLDQGWAVVDENVTLVELDTAAETLPDGPALDGSGVEAPSWVPPSDWTLSMVPPADRIAIPANSRNVTAWGHEYRAHDPHMETIPQSGIAWSTPHHWASTLERSPYWHREDGTLRTDAGVYRREELDLDLRYI